MKKDSFCKYKMCCKRDTIYVVSTGGLVSVASSSRPPNPPSGGGPMLSFAFPLTEKNNEWLAASVPIEEVTTPPFYKNILGKPWQLTTSCLYLFIYRYNCNCQT